MARAVWPGAGSTTKSPGLAPSSPPPGQRVRASVGAFLPLSKGWRTLAMAANGRPMSACVMPERRVYPALLLQVMSTRDRFRNWFSSETVTGPGRLVLLCRAYMQLCAG